MYKDEIIHFFGGVQNYLGQLDQSEHPNGPGWYRIKNPCNLYISQDKDVVRTQITRIWGVDKFYRKFVDIYCPLDSIMEIRVLDKEGGLYKSYMKELDRPDLNLIKSPTDEDIGNVGKNRLN